MNEHDDINLPADFDDLSKYAPLLENIRVKGDGFVVPEGYFDEAVELSVAGCQLPVVNKENGFVVPENYFEELAERIIAIVTLSTADNRLLTTDNPFTVPPGYFENLTNEILTVAKLSELKTGESFEVPNSYFNELDETINTKLALDNLKQDEGFIVPENYFEKFSDKILAHLAVDELGKGSDADVPSGYFDTLADKISARIAEEEGLEPEETIERGRIIVFAEVLKRYARPISVAASVTLLLGVSIWFFNQNQQNTDQNKIAKVITPKKNIQPVIPPTKKDSVIIQAEPQNVAVQPKNNIPEKVNLNDNPVVQEVDSKDVLEQLYLLDENMVAEYITDQNPGITPQEELLDEEMLNYLDPSDIK